MVGLLGDADGGIGNHTDDLVTRDGQPITFPNTPFSVLYGTYVNSWRISNAESMFDYGAGQTTETLSFTLAACRCVYSDSESATTACFVTP